MIDAEAVGVGQLQHHFFSMFLQAISFEIENRAYYGSILVLPVQPCCFVSLMNCMVLVLGVVPSTYIVPYTTTSLSDLQTCNIYHLQMLVDALKCDSMLLIQQ